MRKNYLEIITVIKIIIITLIIIIKLINNFRNIMMRRIIRIKKEKSNF